MHFYKSQGESSNVIAIVTSLFRAVYAVNEAGVVMTYIDGIKDVPKNSVPVTSILSLI